MLLKKKFLILAVFILFVFALLTYQSTKDEKNSISDLPLHPLKSLEQGISILGKSIKSFFKSYILIVGKEEENRRLVEQIKKIEHEKNEYLEAKYENKRLRALLELKSERVEYITTAEVFARDPTNWFQLLWINKGSVDNISRDMIAVTPSGIVGRVLRVLKNRASIILITDINSSVAARIQSSRIEGILEGSGDNKCYLKYVPHEADVKIGAKIITSGLDGMFPPGLQIGYVADVIKKSGELFQVIEVATAENLKAIEEVSILKR